MRVVNLTDRDPAALAAETIAGKAREIGALLGVPEGRMASALLHEGAFMIASREGGPALVILLRELADLVQLGDGQPAGTG